jgi:hypothetical protein
MKACQWKVIACSLALLAAGCGDSVSVDSGRMQVSAAARTAASSAGQAAALASDCSPSANPAAAPSDCANPIAARIGAGTRSINVTADVSTGNHTREVIEAEDVRRFRMHGFNHFRVFLPVRLAMPGLATDATIAAFHQALAADLEAWLGEGMGVTLTPFIAEADMPNILGTAAGRVAFSNFLGDLAARYGHHPSDLLSFEVLNEPHSITGSVGSDCAFPACSPPIWRDLQLGFVSAIRKSAPGHTVIVSAADWNNPPALLRFVPYDDPNLIYAFHYYPAQVFVAQSAWLPEHGLRYPSCLPGNAATAGAIRDSGQAAAARQYAEGGWSRERMLDELAQLADWAERNGVRVFANEIGAFPLDLESRTRWVRDQRLALEQLRIPWTVWSVFDYYTRGWVHGDRVPVAELLRGVGGMPWMYPDPSCGAQPAARVDLSATIEPGSTEFRIAVGNAGPDTATNVEARIGLLEHEVIGAGARPGQMPGLARARRVSPGRSACRRVSPDPRQHSGGRPCRQRGPGVRGLRRPGTGRHRQLRGQCASRPGWRRPLGEARCRS